ncbi:MAG: hypothetical protein A3F43_04215 [Gammaproteobacteria bacterium RIFCSPHIGHO2_12_FULL_42_10]|nr:MAG: hypothetical protein A3F43_04215 [Gammaproteobacteria bacterium RIFCSPHIGHO2_12_FULL_42_10]
MIGDKLSLDVIEHTTLKHLPMIRHAFFTRFGGVSRGRYASLNSAYKSHDDSAAVRENRTRITHYFGKPLEALVTVNNIHSNQVVVVDEPWLECEKPCADAIVTKQKGLLLGSDSADCAIVLFADVKAGVVGLAHAGWRGAKCGVLASTVHAMMQLGAEPCEIVAVIGPCIAQASYEVSADYYQQFVNDSSDNQRYFKNSQQANHFMFDLPAYVADRLVQLGLKSVGQTGIDTYTDERFFSCRRAYHQGEDDFGCHFSCIGLI